MKEKVEKNLIIDIWFGRSQKIGWLLVILFAICLLGLPALGYFYISYPGIANNEIISIVFIAITILFVFYLFAFIAFFIISTIIIFLQKRKNGKKGKIKKQEVKIKRANLENPMIVYKIIYQNRKQIPIKELTIAGLSTCFILYLYYIFSLNLIEWIYRVDIFAILFILLASFLILFICLYFIYIYFIIKYNLKIQS